MPMIDVYAAEGTFADKHRLAQDLANAGWPTTPSSRGSTGPDPPTAARRHTKRFPNAVMVHTPIHASWLNQVEIIFSVVQRKVVSPNDFTNLDQIEQRLAAFERRYYANARPFRWEFTTADLDDLLARSNATNSSKPPPP
jgi:hypothetical protein